MGISEPTALGGGPVAHVRFTCPDGDRTEGVFLGVDRSERECVVILQGGRIVRRATVNRDGTDREFTLTMFGRSETVPGASLAKGVAHVALATGGFAPRERAA